MPPPRCALAARSRVAASRGSGPEGTFVAEFSLGCPLGSRHRACLGNGTRTRCAERGQAVRVTDPVVGLCQRKSIAGLLTRLQPCCRLRNAARDSAVGVGARAVASPRPTGMSRNRNTAQSAPHFVPSVNRGADILSEYRQAIDEHIREGKMPTPTGVSRCPNPNNYSCSPDLQLAPLWCSSP